MNSSSDALRLFERVDEDNLYLQYDFYHMQRVQGELIANFLELMPRIAHVQIADNPGRNEPGSGEINYPFIFAALEKAGYEGWVGAEYKPAGNTSQGLGWLKSYRKEAK